MLRQRYLLGIGAIALALLLISIGVLASCDRLATATLEVRNETDEPIVIEADSGWAAFQEEVAAHSTEVLKMGILFGRWGAPSGHLFVTKHDGESSECLWSDVKRNEPLVISSDGVNCDDVSLPFPPP